MKKYIPYILALLLAGAVIAMVSTGKNKTSEKKLDERITLKRQDKIPYGTYVAFQELGQIFPSATVSTNLYEPGYWDSLSYYESDQALIIVTTLFNANEIEMKKLISFIEKGNDVFVSALSFSYSAADLTKSRIDFSGALNEAGDKLEEKEDLHLSLMTPPFEPKPVFTYPGKGLDGIFDSYDEDRSEVLGVNAKGRPDFIRLRAGKGNLYLHLAPMAFTNYFLLHGNNIDYYEKVMSVISPTVKKVVWDEYYLNKRSDYDDRRDKKNWFTVLMKEKNGNGDHSFRAAFWLLIVLLAIYVLQEMRRKQRIIPLMTKPKNESMEFVKTIGRLYFDRGDHKNLARKMSAYFLEHVRNKYKLLTGTLDEEFVRNLRYKSGAEEHEVREIVGFIKYVDDAPAISEKELVHFHHQLELFYKRS